MSDFFKTVFMLIGIFGLIVNTLAQVGFDPVASRCDEIPFCFITMEIDNG